MANDYIVRIVTRLIISKLTWHIKEIKLNTWWALRWDKTTSGPQSFPNMESDHQCHPVSKLKHKGVAFAKMGRFLLVAIFPLRFLQIQKYLKIGYKTILKILLYQTIDLILLTITVRQSFILSMPRSSTDMSSSWPRPVPPPSPLAHIRV